MVRWFVATAVLTFAVPSIAAAATRTMGDCFADLERGTKPDIVCNFPLRPSEAERAELEKQTSGFVKDIICTVAIRIERALIHSAIVTPDYQFEAPPQPVACNVTMPGKTGPNPTPDQIISINGQFAPKVTIKDGLAIAASPGLSDVTGVSRILSVPVVAYVNRAGFLREGMLKIVNAWMVHMRNAKAKAG